jgi:hypothetical protein
LIKANHFPFLVSYPTLGFEISLEHHSLHSTDLQLLLDLQTDFRELSWLLSAFLGLGVCIVQMRYDHDTSRVAGPTGLSAEKVMEEKGG